MSVRNRAYSSCYFTSMALLIGYVSQQLAPGDDKDKSLLLASPFAVIIMLKLYFIFKIADDIRKI